VFTANSMHDGQLIRPVLGRFAPRTAVGEKEEQYKAGRNAQK